MKSFFLSNLGTKLISIVIAIILWMVVLQSRTVEITKEIPIELMTASDVVASNEIPDRIAFRMSGPKAFLRAVLDRREDPIRVNLTGAKPGLVTYRFFSDVIRVPLGVKVLSINPTAIVIKLEYVKRKEVPVKIETRGVPPEGMKITKVEIVPPTVRIRGAESRVDAIAEMASLPLDLSTVDESFEREIPLDTVRNHVWIDSAPPKIKVQVEGKSVQYRIRNADLKVSSKHKVRVAESTVSILVRAAPQDLRLLDKSRIYGYIEMGSKPTGKYLEPVKVRLPERVYLIKVQPEKVSVTLHD